MNSFLDFFSPELPGLTAPSSAYSQGGYIQTGTKDLPNATRVDFKYPAIILGAVVLGYLWLRK